MFEHGQWAILELMGHRRLGGWVSEVELFGAKMCRIDVPLINGETDPTRLLMPRECEWVGNIHVTQFYGGSSVYCVTPCTREAALEIAPQAQPRAMQTLQLSAGDDEEEDFGDEPL